MFRLKISRNYFISGHLYYLPLIPIQYFLLFFEHPLLNLQSLGTCIRFGTSHMGDLIPFF